MKKKLLIPSVLGFCKQCFNRRRDGSAFCGECRDATGGRMEIYFDEQNKFPLMKEAKKLFPIDARTIFTYGDTIYADQEPSPALVAHELTHVFQQKEMGEDDWWGRYLVDTNFRLVQETEAYRNQHSFNKKTKEKEKDYLLDYMARDLSGKLYGNIISFEQAKKLINNK